MVRHCFICEVYDYQIQDKEISFHQFPKNVERRRIWMSLLNIDETQAIPSQLEICSNHFQQSDFIHGLGGVKRLKRDAVPLPLHSQLDHMTSVSSESPDDSIEP